VPEHSRAHRTHVRTNGPIKDPKQDRIVGLRLGEAKLLGTYGSPVVGCCPLLRGASPRMIASLRGHIRRTLDRMWLLGIPPADRCYVDFAS